MSNMMYVVGKIDREPFDILYQDKMIVDMLEETNSISYFGKGYGGTIYLTKELLKSITALIEREKKNYTHQEVLSAFESVVNFKKMMDTKELDEVIIYFK